MNRMVDVRNVINWDSRPRRARKPPPPSYWEEYVETDDWYLHKLVEDVPEDELHAACFDENVEHDDEGGAGGEDDDAGCDESESTDDDYVEEEECLSSEAETDYTEEGTEDEVDYYDTHSPSPSPGRDDAQ